MSWDEDDLLKTDAKAVIIDMALHPPLPSGPEVEEMIAGALAILTRAQRPAPLAPALPAGMFGFVATLTSQGYVSWWDRHPAPEPPPIAAVVLPHAVILDTRGIYWEHVHDMMPWAVTFIGIAAIVGALR